MSLIRIHPRDNVAVALEPLPEGRWVTVERQGLRIREAVPQGHKLALTRLEAGMPILKYGCVIGSATQEISPGAWVHTHNVRTLLREEDTYTYAPEIHRLPQISPQFFQGFRRPNGQGAIRNELWILPTVGCVNSVAQTLASGNQHLVQGTVTGLYAFPHPYGCSQMGTDHAQTRKLLAALARHPNAGGVLVLGLGCENNTMAEFQQELGEWDAQRVKFLVCQEVEDEMAAGNELLAEMASYAQTFSRQPISVEELIVGLKCGGSDGFSGITANPVVGRFSDRLIAMGGSTMLTEVPEMFGAEALLLNRCVDEMVFHQAEEMLQRFKRYFIERGQAVYENPSPGNREGGITTLEDKSCGCVQKSGDAPIVDVLDYGETLTRRGLNLLNGPGNDLVSSTALAAAGAHLILFTTGRGTPFGAPVPTMKIASNTELYHRKRNWMDFDAGSVATGDTPEQVAEKLLQRVLDVAGGAETQTEKNGYREMAIFKDGVTL